MSKAHFYRRLPALRGAPLIAIVFSVACAAVLATPPVIDEITIYRGDVPEVVYRPQPGVTVIKWRYSDGGEGFHPAIAPEPVPATRPAELVGTKVFSGSAIPALVAGETILLERGATFDLPAGLVPPEGATIDGGSFGDQAKPSATLRCTAAGRYPVLIDVQHKGVTLRDLCLASDNREAKGVVIAAADCSIERLVLAGPNFTIGLEGQTGCARLRVRGYSATEKIYGASWYGRGEDIEIDLDGGTLPGSLEENVIRTVLVKGFTVRNGTILAPPVTSPSSGREMIKSALTIQQDSRDVTLEDLTIEGVIGIGPIDDQTLPVVGVTLRRITAPKGRQIGINKGASRVIIEDSTWHNADGRPPIQFGKDNPAFAEKPDVTVRRFTGSGGPDFVSGASRGKLTIGEGVTHNGVEVR